MIIDGINAIAEALRSGVVSEIWIRRDAGRRVDQVVERARREKIPVHSLDLQEIELILGRQVHQGVAADVLDTQPDTLEDLCRNLSDNPLLLVLDGIEDPMNFGAIARSAEAVGVDALIFQTRRSAQVNAVSNKASAGALMHLRLVSVTNISRALDELKKLGVWTIGLDSNAKKSFDSLDLIQPTAFVLGGEGHGLRRLVRERCDWLASIPMSGKIPSLNVSVAAGVALFEAVRQRRVRN